MPTPDDAPWWQELFQLLRDFAHPHILIEMGALLVCVLIAWIFASGLRRTWHQDGSRSILFGRRVFDGALFPLLLLGLGYVARTAVAKWVPIALFKVAIPVLIALVVIRIGVKVLQVAFPSAKWMRPMERSISWLAWMGMVLWVSGLLPRVLAELDTISWKVGGTTLSLRTILEGTLTAGVVLVVSLWVSAAIESRLLKDVVGAELSVRKAISNALRAGLMFIGLIMALSAVGIDLTALSVLGGAIGVGIGFGLQKLAANYVSGFVILAERSMRIGDNVRVDTFEGRITNINARYTIIRSVGGRESIVPNEMLLTQRVENLSLADTRVFISSTVSVGYQSDVDTVTRLLHESVLSSPRVLADPEPTIALSAFGADGLEFTVGYWIADPENGTLSLRSSINKAILTALRTHQIDIPYPQRVVHIKPQADAQMAGGGHTPLPAQMHVVQAEPLPPPPSAPPVQ